MEGRFKVFWRTCNHRRNGAGNGVNGEASHARHNGEAGHARYSERFLAGLANASAVTFVSHVYPDPDSLGSMLGLAHLVETRLNKPTRLTRDGPISRAENRAMVTHLGINLVPIEEVTGSPGEALVMVDSQPNTGRHTFDFEIPLYAVIDHHDTSGEIDDIPFVDVRRGLGATCSLVTSYLMEQSLGSARPPRHGPFLRHRDRVERFSSRGQPARRQRLALSLSAREQGLAARIRNARLPQSYFECIVQALQSSFVYDQLIISWVNELPQPELAAEVVDFLIRFEEIDWAVCAGVYEDQLVLSVRAAQRGSHAGETLRQVVGKLGRAGGHDRRAGGTVPLPSTAASAVEQLQSELRRRLLKALRIDECRGQRLVPRRELLQNLQA